MEEQKRFLNFTKNEIDLLVSLVEKYRSIIECKKSSLNGKLSKEGGGQPTQIKIDENDIKVKSIVGIGVVGLPNPFDSDGPLFSLRSLQNSENNVEIVVEQDNDNEFNHLLQESESVEKEKFDQIDPWHKWCPGSLKEPKSIELQTEESKNKKSVNASTRKCSKQRTQDCRTKINLVSEAKLELIKLQKSCFQEEHIAKMQEYKLRTKNLEELHKLEIEEKKIKIEILKKQLNLD
ncbi:hypothetical protein ABEB36_000117 [Hypothenemus hampei]|uniref:Uncharacterized protein n=1 Tax=Hypothenemus hampei TaxID=57062 RepID=A0ABD1FDX2_HYPHA